MYGKIWAEVFPSALFTTEEKLGTIAFAHVNKSWQSQHCALLQGNLAPHTETQERGCSQSCPSEPGLRAL